MQLPALEHLFQDEKTNKNYLKYAADLDSKNIKINKPPAQQASLSLTSKPMSLAKKLALRADFRKKWLPRRTIDASAEEGNIETDSQKFN